MQQLQQVLYNQLCVQVLLIGGDCFAIIALNGKIPVAVNGSGIAPKKLT